MLSILTRPPNGPSDLRIRLKNLLKSQKHTDCSFRVENTILNSHKVILCTASPVFEAMFYGPLAETRCIHIADITADTFKLMLEYIYTDEVDLTGTQIEDILELYYCAKKYMLTVLMQKCDHLIRTTLRHENILQAIDMAVAMNIPELLDITIGFFTKYCLIGRFFTNILLQNDFHMSKESLNYILASDIKQQNINLVCLIRKWCRMEAEQQALRPEDIRQTLAGIRVPDDIADDVAELQTLVVADGALKNSRLAWQLCQRQHYKAVRPLRIGMERSFETSLQSSRLIALRALVINSQLTPFVRTGESNNIGGRSQVAPSSYTEQLMVRVSAGACETKDFTVDQKFVLFNTEYNSTVSLVFENPIMMPADVRYKISMEWKDYCVGCEYPRSVLSPMETVGGGLCTLQFDQHLGNSGLVNQYGSILAGVEFVVLG